MSDQRTKPRPLLGSAGAASARDAAQALERAIGEGRYVDRLPPERSLAAQFAISRNTVREALSLLEARGLVTRRQGSGTYVNTRSERQVAEVWGDMARRHPRLQVSLIEFRTMLETETAAMAALRHRPRDRGRLQQAGAAVEAAYAGGDRRAQVESDAAFHRAIADATQNPVFAYLMTSLLSLLHDHIQLSVAGLAAQSATAQALRAQHRELLAAILARDGAGARAAAQRHLDFVRVQLNQLEPQAAPEGGT